MGRRALQRSIAVPQSVASAVGESQACASAFNSDRQGSVTAIGSRDGDIQHLFKDIGAFLSAHRLFPTPANYALVFTVVTEPDGPAAKQVTAIVADGMRLSQDDADRIRIDCGIDGAQAPAPTQESLTRARRQIEDFATIVEATRAETQAYGADLASRTAELREAAVDHPAVSDVVRITGAMIERTRATETQLDAAREEARALRKRLAEAVDEARRDPLTGLPNRRALDDRLAELTAEGGLCAIAICDIDRFKSINDSHGHAIGDRVLKMFAEVLSANCEDHMVARIGGEEFVILFEGMSPTTAGALLDEARQDLADRNFRIRGAETPLGQVTFSAGVAHCVEREGEAALQRADDLLYRAKNAGRNQVLVEVA